MLQATLFISGEAGLDAPATRMLLLPILDKIAQVSKVSREMAAAEEEAAKVTVVKTENSSSPEKAGAGRIIVRTDLASRVAEDDVMIPPAAGANGVYDFDDDEV